MKSLFNRPGFWMIVGPFEIMAFMWAAERWGYPQWCGPLFILACMIPQAVLQSLYLDRRIPDVTMYSMMGILIVSVIALSIWKITAYYPVMSIALGLGVVLYVSVWAIRKGLHRQLWAALKATDWHEAEIAHQLARDPAWQTLSGIVALFVVIGLFAISQLLPMNGWMISFATLIAGVVFFLNWWENGPMFVPNTTFGAAMGGSILTVASWFGLHPDGWMLLGFATVIGIVFVLTYMSYVEMEPDPNDFFWYR